MVGCRQHLSLRSRAAWMQVVALFKSYFNAFDEDALRNNFVLIYELLDGALCSLVPVCLLHLLFEA